MRFHSSVHFVHCRSIGSGEMVNPSLRIFLHLSLCSEQTVGTGGLVSPGYQDAVGLASNASPVEDDGTDRDYEGHGSDGL